MCSSHKSISKVSPDECPGEAFEKYFDAYVKNVSSLEIIILVLGYPFCSVIDSERRSSRPNALAALINSIRTCARDHKDFGIYQSIFKQLRSVMKYVPALALPLEKVIRFAVTLTTNAGAVCTFLEITHVLKEGKDLLLHCF